MSDPVRMNATIATETRWPGSLKRMVRLLGETDRITSEWRKKHDAILRQVGQSMRDERERRKISLRELARRLDVSAPHLSDMERGNRKYTIEWCKKAMLAMQPNNKFSDADRRSL